MLDRGRTSAQPQVARAGLLLAVTYAAIAVQAVHAVEHVAQVGYWMAQPTESPWISPWAALGRDGLAAVTDGHAGSGNELLHLSGNLAFLAGLVAAAMVARSWQVPPTRVRWLRWGLWLQGAHVVEHVALTASAFLLGEGHGVSTAFGLLAPGTVVASAVRVWLHLILNLTATTLALGGLVQLRAAGRASHAVDERPGPAGGGRSVPTLSETPSVRGFSRHR